MWDCTELKSAGPIRLKPADGPGHVRLPWLVYPVINNRTVYDKNVDICDLFVHTLQNEHLFKTFDLIPELRTGTVLKNFTKPDPELE